MSEAAQTVGAEDTATAFINQRELQRRANGGFLVPSPIPVAFYSRARMQVHRSHSTLPHPNAEMNAMRVWLDSIDSAGGTSADLRRAFQDAWQTEFRQQKAPLRSHFEELCKKADAREVELAAAAGKEGELERHVQRARMVLERCQAEERDVRAELGKAINDTKIARDELAAAERVLRESKQ